MPSIKRYSPPDANCAVAMIMLRRPRARGTERETWVMAMTAVGRDFGQPAATGCWCCGDRTVTASLLRLGEHPEVGVCFRCVRVLARRKREMERRTRVASVGWPFWRRVLFRLGLNRC